MAENRVEEREEQAKPKHAAGGHAAEDCIGPVRCDRAVPVWRHVSGIKRSKLCNAGLLTASLTDDPDDSGARRELLDVKCVVQVSKSGSDLTRMIFNPLSG